MESDTRDATDRQGFCRKHTKMMFDYGNTLGNAWILKTRLTYVREKLKKEMQEYTPGAAPKRGLFKKKPENGNSVASGSEGKKATVTSVSGWTIPTAAWWIPLCIR